MTSFAGGARFDERIAGIPGIEPWMPDVDVWFEQLDAEGNEADVATVQHRG